jgi:hypothetical protein
MHACMAHVLPLSVICSSSSHIPCFGNCLLMAFGTEKPFFCSSWLYRLFPQECPRYHSLSSGYIVCVTDRTVLIGSRPKARSGSPRSLFRGNSEILCSLGRVTAWSFGKLRRTIFVSPRGKKTFKETTPLTVVCFGRTVFILS